VPGLLRNLLAGGPEAAEAFLRDWFGPLREQWVGARDPPALAYLDDLVDESWEYYSLRDRD